MFLSDYWVCISRLRNSFPRLYRLETMTSFLVSNRSPLLVQHSAPSQPALVSSAHPTVLTDNPIDSPNGVFFNWAWRQPLRSGPELLQLSDLINLLVQSRITTGPVSWECTGIPSTFFVVKGMRLHISTVSNTLSPDRIRWNKLLPAKININTWRINNRRLLTLINLDKRGIDLVRCQICDSDFESEEHVFCCNATDTWHKVLNWWNLNSPYPSSLSDLVFLADRIPFAVHLSILWMLWFKQLCRSYGVSRMRFSLLPRGLKRSLCSMM